MADGEACKNQSDLLYAAGVEEGIVDSSGFLANDNISSCIRTLVCTV